MDPRDYTNTDQKLIEGIFKANMSDVTFLKKITEQTEQTKD